MTIEIFNPEKREALKPQKYRIVIYGNNWQDCVCRVSDWASETLSETHPEDEFNIRICKNIDEIESVFFDQAIPDLVLAGQYIRKHTGAGYNDLKLDEVAITTIEHLCKEYSVPLVRFEFDNASNKHQTVSGEMVLKEQVETN